MSSTSDEDSPRPRARLSNRHERSSARKRDSTSFKRKNDDRSDNREPMTSSKNLANTRLQNLRKSIEADAKNRNTNKPCTARYSTVDSDKDVNENKEKSALATQGMKKNTANERLKGIKRRLASPDYGPSTSGVANRTITENRSKIVEQPHCSKLPDESRVTCGIKRNIHRITDSNDDLERSPKRLATSKTIASPSKVQDNKISYDLSIPSTSQASDNRSETDTTSKAVRENLTDYKETISHISPLSGEEEYLCKMARAASWVISHQQAETVNTSSSNTSLNVNVSESRTRLNFDETEDMEWANAEPDEVDNKNVSSTEKRVPDEEKERLNNIVLVADTNIFISSLSKIQEILNMRVGGTRPIPIIYIPWMVLTELDYIKDKTKDSNLKENVCRSIRFINNALAKSHPRLLGETIRDVEKQQYIGKCPDDKILASCLQVAQKYKHIILISNDINLRNRAMVNNITTCSAKDIIMKIMSISPNDKFKKIQHKMGILCSSIICECAKAEYGDLWSKMGMLSCPPWSLVECLKRFRKYWEAVFKDKLLKQFPRALEELLHFLQTHKYICDDSEEFSKFMKLCITLCIFLKDIEECRGLVENTLDVITKIA